MFIKLLIGITPVAYASVDTFIKKLNTYIFNPVIKFLVVAAVAYFLYGIFEYLQGRNSDEARDKGRRHMTWGAIGLFIMIGVFFIMKVILGTIGLDESNIDVRTGEVHIDDVTPGGAPGSGSPFGS